MDLMATTTFGTLQSDGMTSFTQKVHAAAKKIPRGKVSTYGAVAFAVGDPGAARAVGNALNKSPGMPSCPCHRVIRSNGDVGGFANDTPAKVALLKKDGVVVANNWVDLRKYGFWSFPK